MRSSTSKGIVGICVCFGRKGRRPRLHHYELPQSFDARASTPYSVEDCRHPHIVPEQQESEKSAERRRQQLVAKRWRMNTRVEIRPSTWVAQDSTACVCSRKQRRDETSQGTWDAWCRAKVHGKLTSKLYLAHRPNCPHVSSRKIWEKPWRSYTAGIDAVIVDHQKLDTSSSMHSGTRKQAQGLWRGGAWWRDMTDHRASFHSKTGNEISDRAQHEDTAARHTYVLQATECERSSTAAKKTVTADQ